MTNFNSNLGNFIVDGFIQGAQRKELINAPFVKRFKGGTLRKLH